MKLAYWSKILCISILIITINSYSLESRRRKLKVGRTRTIENCEVYIGLEKDKCYLCVRGFYFKSETEGV